MKRINNQKSFTLIEMLVSVTLFSLVVTAISNLFFTGINSQTKTLATQELIDQTSYALEYMGKAIRMANKELINPPYNCLSTKGLNYEVVGGNDLRFRSYDTDIGCQRFFLDNGQLKEQREWILSGGQPSGGKTLALTSITITSLKFNLSGENQTDSLQPRVTIFMDFLGKTSRFQPKIQIQTSISQRNFDVLY